MLISWDGQFVSPKVQKKKDQKELDAWLCLGDMHAFEIKGGDYEERKSAHNY